MYRPIVARTLSEAREAVRHARSGGATIGLVPTMGALHAGHRSLIERARAECGYVVVSLFVNPIQFGPGEDYARYPRDFEGDLALCRDAGVDLVFSPTVEEMYPVQNLVDVDIRRLGDHLCGALRPGHFRGVCTVVAKLFLIVGPDRAYFGEKDAQQLSVIRRMVLDLDFPVEVVGCPIVRESDGVAMSSRNAYLDHTCRVAARIVPESLAAARMALEAGERSARGIEDLLRARIGQEPLARLDYASVVDLDELQPVGTIDGPVLVAVAVRFGTTRLIDNFRFEPPAPHPRR